MELAEFREELGDALLERLVDEGYETARNVLEASTNDLLVIEGLTEEKIKAIKEMMQREFEQADVAEDDEDGDDEAGDEESESDAPEPTNAADAKSEPNDQQPA
jgi:ERCC4-type nuclease